MRTVPKRGGAFLLEATLPEEVFVPEMFSAEDQLIGKSAEQFLYDRVLPHTEAIERGDHLLIRSLMQQAGELGLLAADIPEVYGGLGLSQKVCALIAEKLNFQQSFALTHEAHTVLGTLPLLYFGNHEQKSRYLPKLASGEYIGAFALSEARSGSDVLGLQTFASLSPGGEAYLLQGEKMWITNAAFADLFTVFARTGPRSLTAFLVERGAQGLSMGREEHKLGMHGTSTRRLVFENVRVPSANAFAEGEGHHAAFCTLNLGRLRLEAGAVGGLKRVLALSANYAKQRKTFGRPIAEYGLIRYKLAEMAAHILVLESMVYRLSDDLDTLFQDIVPDSAEASAGYRHAAEEFSVECCAVKVIGSEIYSLLTDEAIQLHGGYGYTEELPFARAWRDQRLLRIGEGANEVLRLAIVSQWMRKTPASVALEEAIEQLNAPIGQPCPAFRALNEAVPAAKRATLFLLNALTQKEDWKELQEAVAAVADMIGATYALESLLLRGQKNSSLSSHTREGMERGVLVGALDYSKTFLRSAEEAVACLEITPAQKKALTSLLAPLHFEGTNPMRLRRELAEWVLEGEEYPFK